MQDADEELRLHEQKHGRSQKVIWDAFNAAGFYITSIITSGVLEMRQKLFLSLKRRPHVNHTICIVVVRAKLNTNVFRLPDSGFHREVVSPSLLCAILSI